MIQNARNETPVSNGQPTDAYSETNTPKLEAVNPHMHSACCSIPIGRPRCLEWPRMLTASRKAQQEQETGAGAATVRM